MTKRWIAGLLAVLLVAGLFAGCSDKNETLTIDKAQQIVLEKLEEDGVNTEGISMHSHVTTYEGEACYGIYVTLAGKTHEYVIHGTTGEILAINESEHSH